MLPDSLICCLVELCVVFRAEASAVGVHGGGGDRAEPSEGFPYHVAWVRGCPYGQFQEFNGLLVLVQGLVGIFDSFRTSDRLLAPDVGDAHVAVELGAHEGPFVACGRSMPVDAVVGSAVRVSILVDVLGQGGEGFGGWKVPRAAFREVLAGCGVPDSAGFICFVQGQSAAFPFVPDPFLESHWCAVGVDLDLADILYADLGDHGETAQGLGVGVACDVTQSFVPDVTFPVFPS